MAKKNNNKNNFQPKVKEYKNKIILMGTVSEALPNAMFKVLLENGHVVLCTISGPMKKNHIRVLPDDKVQLGVEQYDLNRGIIIYVYK